MSKQEWREWIHTIGVVLIPVAVTVIGVVFANSNATREVNAKMIDVAARILSDPPNDSNRTIRQWAAEMMKRYSEVPLSFSAESTLALYLLPGGRPPRNLLDPDYPFGIAHLRISPRTITTFPGEQVEFQVAALNGMGDTLPVDVVWSATSGGTIIEHSEVRMRGRHYTRVRADSRDFSVIAQVPHGVADTALVRVQPRSP